MEWARAARPAKPHRRKAGEPGRDRPAENSLLELQQSAGNAAVTQLLQEHSEVVQRQEAESQPAGPARPVLKLGDSGPAVTKVQRALASLGYPVTVDGTYGARTAAFVCLMQLGLHLPVDGEVGPATWEEVDIFNSLDQPDGANAGSPGPASASSASPATRVAATAGSPSTAQRAKAGGEPQVVSVEDLPKVAPPTLQRGDNGTDVKKLQQALAALYSGAGVRVDGEFGSETAAFVLLFQVQNGLAADGVVGAATHRALDPIARGLGMVAAAREIEGFARDISELSEEDRARLKTLPSGIAADIDELTSDE